MIAIVVMVGGCFTRLEVVQPAPATAVAAPFSLSAQDGTTVTLAGVLAENHAVLVFYRGHW
jgi:peroxiredoxin